MPSVVWANLSFPEWGDGKLHLSDLPDIVDLARDALNDTLPEECFDGFLCISDRTLGLANFERARQLIAQQPPGAHAFGRCFSAASAGKLLPHPLLTMRASFAVLGPRLCRDLKQVKLFLVDEPYDVACLHPEKHELRMKALLAEQALRGLCAASANKGAGE